MNRIAFLVTLTALTANVLMAQKHSWRLDRAHSEVTFSIEHMAISEVTGEFNDFDITFTSKTEDFAEAAVTAVLQVNSIDTDNERRDNHLRSDDFFSAEKFPTITFSSTSFEKVGERSYKIHGNLTIRDVTREVVFDAIHRGTIETRQGVMTAWKAILAINRFDYNLMWDRAIETGGLVAGKMVTITLKLEFRNEGSS